MGFEDEGAGSGSGSIAGLVSVVLETINISLDNSKVFKAVSIWGETVFSGSNV